MKEPMLRRGDSSGNRCDPEDYFGIASRVGWAIRPIANAASGKATRQIAGHATPVFLVVPLAEGRQLTEALK